MATRRPIIPFPSVTRPLRVFSDGVVTYMCLAYEPQRDGYQR